MSSNAEVIAAAETWLDGQPSELFFVELLAKVRVWSLLLVSFLVGLRNYQHPGSCIKCTEFLDQLRNCQLLNKNSHLCIQLLKEEAIKTCNIGGSHGGVADDLRLLRCYAMLLGGSRLFKSIVVPSSCGSRIPRVLNP